MVVMFFLMWFWMVYIGVIDYFDLEFGGVEWVDGVSLLWISVSDKVFVVCGFLRLCGKVRRFRIDDGIFLEKKVVVVFDILDELK